MAEGKGQAKVAVCLLSYNHAHVIEQAIRSLLEQDYGDFELLVSDDCSSDGSFSLLQAWARREPRLQVLRTPRNLGMAGNANWTVRQTAAPYLALLHHDDVYRPSLPRRWAEVLDRHPSAAFVASGYAHPGAAPHLHSLAERNEGRRVLEDFLLRDFGCIFRGTAMVRRSCWDAVGGMRERFGLLSDVDLWMRLCTRFDVGYVAEPLIEVRHDRPQAYPKDYTHWSWNRMRLLYEIHGENLREHYGAGGLRARSQLSRLRWRVTRDVLYWLAYAVRKRRWDILQTSNEVATELELPLLPPLRRGLARAGRLAERLLP